MNIEDLRSSSTRCSSYFSKPHRGARRIAETLEAIDPPHGAVRKG